MGIRRFFQKEKNLMEKQKLLTVNDVALYLNVKISWVRSAVFRKEIPYMKVGNLVRFRQKDLEEWMQKNMVDRP